MGKVIGIANQKGGVGKTTTTITMGSGLERAGKTVLLIDSDPQGSLTDASGYNPDEQEYTLETILSNYIKDNMDFPIEDVILHHEEEYDLIPANLDLSGIEIAMTGALNREYLLREYISRVREWYDYILIDCPPSLNMLTLNVLAAADEILIPVETSYMPAKGLQLLLNSIARTKRRLNPNLEIAGILMTLVDRRTNNSKKIKSIIRESYGSNITIFENEIPLCVKAAEAPEAGMSIFRYDPKCATAIAYEQFIQEFIKKYE